MIGLTIFPYFIEAVIEDVFLPRIVFGTISCMCLATAMTKDHT